MISSMQLTLMLVLFPLIGALTVGLGGRLISYRMAHRIIIFCVALSFILSINFAYELFFLHRASFHIPLYHWASLGYFEFNMGFLIDPLTVVMFLIVSFIALIVLIYSITYMAQDSGYKRFFSYMSAFTFAMLMVVSADNFLQLFFAWEGVGFVSYLLIGFWFKRESANRASVKAFLVNRIGDFGFLLGIAVLFAYVGSLDYGDTFQNATGLSKVQVSLFPHFTLSAATLICFLLLIGASGKSAQIPLHVWLADSMEGPTPVSALIHAATMVTAGIYMIARLSPLYEYAPSVLNLILVLGGTTALAMGLVAIVQNDIKRVIAYSTLSQLGYMMVGLGASAYSASIFHLVTHAFFKALLFLSAGSVILALNHQQDIRKMGRLAGLMPLTCFCFLIGTLALAAFPPFSGFYSKEAIVNAVYVSRLPAAFYAYLCLLIGAGITAFYSFRLFFTVFYAKSHTENETQPLQKTTVITRYSLIILSIPSLGIGFLLAPYFLSPTHLLFGSSLFVSSSHAKALLAVPPSFHSFFGHFFSLTVLFVFAGLFAAWLFYVQSPRLIAWATHSFSWIYQLLVNRYGLDDFNRIVFEKGGTRLAQLFSKIDDYFLDNHLIDGLGRQIARLSNLLRCLQSGKIYHYTFLMVLGILVLLGTSFWLA